MKTLIVLILTTCLISDAKSQVKATPENVALTFLIDSLLPQLPQRDSVLYIQKKSQPGFSWSSFYSLLSKQSLSQSDSIMIKYFNDSLVKNSFYWKSGTEMITKPDDENILKTKSRIKVHYLNIPDKFKYLTDNDLKGLKEGYYISLINSAHVYNLSIVQVFVSPLRYDYNEPPASVGDSRSYYIFLDKENKVLRHYEFVNYPIPATQMNWR